MKRLILTLGIGVAILLLSPCNGVATSGMQFSLLDDQSRDSSPSIMVTFPDGYSDKIILRKHNHNEKDMNENECSYFGHLFKEKETCVAMTGCVGSEDILFTIMSAHAPDSSHFLWNKEGEAYTVEPDEFLQDEMKLMNLEKTDFARSDLFKAQNSDLKMRELEDDVCYYLKPPATALLNIKVAFTEQVFDSVGRNFTKAENNIRRAFAHVQTQYCHPSLGVKIHININEVIFLEGETQKYIQHNGDMVAHMKDVTENIMETGNTLNTTHLVVYIMGHGSGAGEAQADSPCTTNPRDRYVLNSGGLGNIEGILGTVWVVRHELGHAMGMMHYQSYSGTYPEWDCGPGYNIMGGGRRTEWSPCNALDYRRMYTQYHDNWCMPEYPTACSLEARDESMLLFQIEDNNGNVLEDTRLKEASIYNFCWYWGCSVKFEPNEFKDSQFWFLDKNPESDYGYIASNKYVPGDQEGRGGTRALSITLITVVEDLENGGEDCWDGCKKKEGKCDWCGVGNFCCRQGRIGNGCDGTVGGENNHQCLVLETDYEYIGTVGYKEIVQGDAKQLWKKEGNHLISQYNGAILGAHETEGLVAISGDSDTIIPVSINEDATTSFEFSVPDCPNEDVITSANGTFEILNMMTGNYLSHESWTKVITSHSNLGWESQWIWEPKTSNNPDGIWGHVRAQGRGYLSIGAENSITLTSSIKADMVWRRIGDEIVSQNGIRRGNTRRTPFILGEKADGSPFVIRASSSEDANGQWTLSQVADIRRCSTAEGTSYDRECCSKVSPCHINEGDCDTNIECQGNLVCGRNNCPAPFPSSADCCEEP